LTFSSPYIIFNYNIRFLFPIKEKRWKMKIEKFVHDGKTYEIRIISDGESVYVKVFLNNRPVNRFRYSATIDVIQNMDAIWGDDAVRHLIETAKHDVISGLK
jgi:hypothetical protein